jgi:hypothetical protein
MKKILFSAFVLLIVVIGASAQTNITLKGGIQMMGNYNQSIAGVNVGDFDIDMGFSIALEVAYAALEFIEVGVGVEYQIQRSFTDNTDAAMGFIPIYAIVRAKFPLGLFSPFAVGKAGYDIFTGNDYFTGNLGGGFYWSIGGGVIVMDLLIIEVAYSTNYGDVDGLVDITYSHLDISAGLSYTF